MGPSQRKNLDKLASSQVLEPDLDPITESQFVPANVHRRAGLYEYRTLLAFKAVFLLDRPRNTFQNEVCAGWHADRRD